MIPSMDRFWIQEQESVISQFRDQEVILLGLFFLHVLHFSKGCDITFLCWWFTTFYLVLTSVLIVIWIVFTYCLNFLGLYLIFYSYSLVNWLLKQYSMLAFNMARPNLFKLSHIAVYHKIQVKCDYDVFHIYPSWVVALFLLGNRDFLGFRMIFKVWLNQIFSNFNTLWSTIPLLKIWNAGGSVSCWEKCN
jgi:hypothetical protein